MTVDVATLGERALRRLGIAVVPLADRPAITATVAVTDLATAALTWLAVIASDETPAPLDLALAVAKVEAVHASLVAQAFVSWPDTAIPLTVSEEYTMLVALHLAPSFGKPFDPAQQGLLEARVRKVATIMGAPALATGAVMAVHNNLAARGQVRWTVFDIPPAAELPYVMLVAARIAPAFGVKVDPADEAGAARALAQIISLPTSGERVRAEYF